MQLYPKCRLLVPGLTPADEVQLYLNQFPYEERLPQLALVEQRATVGQD